jgi:hypothetical protein
LYTPFKWVFFSSRLFVPEQIPAFMLAAAIDSFLWGYGLAFVWRLVARCLWTARGTGPSHQRRFRFSLRTLLLIQFATAVLLVLAYPRFITGHFCHITIDQLIVTEEGTIFVKYSQFASPGVVTHPQLSTIRDPSGWSNACGWSGTRSGAFRWYAHNTHTCIGGVDLVGMGLRAAEWRRAMNVGVGKSYRVRLGDRLILYSVADPRFANRPYVGYIKVDRF